MQGFGLGSDHALPIDDRVFAMLLSISAEHNRMTCCYGGVGTLRYSRALFYLNLEYKQTAFARLEDVRPTACNAKVKIDIHFKHAGRGEVKHVRKRPL